MMTNKKILAIFALVSCLFFVACGSKKNISFSFDEIQDYYYQELIASNLGCFNPFYFPPHQDFFQNVESQLNELIEDSDYCSVLIRSSIENATCEVYVLYNCKNEINFIMWDGFNRKQNAQRKIQEPEVKKILKTKPREVMIINGDTVLDGTSYYIIKKINDKTYYYANHYGDVDADYKALMDLFKKLL